MLPAGRSDTAAGLPAPPFRAMLCRAARSPYPCSTERMPNRISNRVKFQLERLMLRGAHVRLLLIAAILGLVAFVAGLLVFGSTAGFRGPGEAIWWAFLRLTDPGYLGDDQGTLVRVVSTFLTVFGFVVFVGALVATLTQWLNQTIQTLEEGHTPVSLKNHMVVLGWTNRTAAVVRELVVSEGRMRRFLRRHGARGLRIAILADQVRVPLVRELRDRLGRRWSGKQIVLRSGTPLRLEHLRRVDFVHAAAVLLPAGDFRRGPAGSDTLVIKTLLSMANHPAERDGQPLPPVVAEIFDARKIGIARAAYPGRIELIAGDSIISRLIAQNVRHQGLSAVYGELLTHDRGNEIYIRSCPELAGAPLHGLGSLFPEAILLGAAREHGTSFSPVLNPPGGYVLGESDRLVLLARSYEESAPVSGRGTAPGVPAARVRRPPPERPDRRILVLGWSHRVPALLREFDSYRGERFRIDVLSSVATAERQRHVERYDARPDRIELTHLDGDYTSPSDLRGVDPASYGNVILIGSDWMESGEEADARTILGYLLLREILPETGGPQILVELLDPENLSLFRSRPGEVLISPMILSHMLAQVALRPELRSVFDELFGPGGAEISFSGAERYGVAGREVRFAELQERAAAHGEVALGVRLSADASGWNAGVRLNPPKEQRWTLAPGDEVVVLATYD